MIASKLKLFLEHPKSKILTSEITSDQVFGCGISWNKKTQHITCVRLIVRDKFTFDSFKKFAKTVEDRSAFTFFNTYPRGNENPDQGLHGNIFSLKIDSRLGSKIAFYRRLCGLPISYESGEWFRYEYENFSEYYFPTLQFPKEQTEKLFLSEMKSPLKSGFVGSCLYPKYSVMKSEGGIEACCEDFFAKKDILINYSNIKIDFLSFIKEYEMTPVSMGETPDEIKIYFVDFGRKRYLFNSPF